MSETINERYPDTMVSMFKDTYLEATTDAERKQVIQDLSAKVGYTIASIRTKLVRMKIYIKPEKVTKSGTKSVKKADIVQKIAELTGKDPDLMGSLEQATKFALEAVRDTLIANKIELNS